MSWYRKNVLRYIAIFFSLYCDILRYTAFIIFSLKSNINYLPLFWTLRNRIMIIYLHTWLYKDLLYNAPWQNHKKIDESVNVMIIVWKMCRVASRKWFNFYFVLVLLCVLYKYKDFIFSAFTSLLRYFATSIYSVFFSSILNSFLTI